MKSQIAILYVLVSLCLAFSLAALLVVASDHGVFAPNNPSTTPLATESPTNSPTPPQTIETPQPAPPNTALTINYQETSREENSGKAKVTLTVTVTYQNGGEITLNYNQFYLQLYSPRMIYYMYEGTINYPNTGTLTLGPQHTTQTFQLTYEFGTDGFNGMDPAPVYYQLQLNSTATTNWPNQTYH